MGEELCRFIGGGLEMFLEKIWEWVSGPPLPSSVPVLPPPPSVAAWLLAMLLDAMALLLW